MTLSSGRATACHAHLALLVHHHRLCHLAVDRRSARTHADEAWLRRKAMRWHTLVGMHVACTHTQVVHLWHAKHARRLSSQTAWSGSVARMTCSCAWCSLYASAVCWHRHSALSHGVPCWHHPRHAHVRRGSVWPERAASRWHLTLRCTVILHRHRRHTRVRMATRSGHSLKHGRVLLRWHLRRCTHLRVMVLPGRWLLVRHLWMTRVIGW